MRPLSRFSKEITSSGELNRGFYGVSTFKQFLEHALMPLIVRKTNTQIYKLGWDTSNCLTLTQKNYLDAKRTALV